MSVDYIIKEFETQGYDKDNLKKLIASTLLNYGYQFMLTCSG